MKVLINFLFIIFVFQAGSAQSRQADEIAMLKFDEFQPLLKFNNDTTYVINFWATWCVPCRKELPEFEKIYREYRDKPVKVLLVSLDFPNRIESAMIPFLEEKNITAPVLVLNDPNSNAWIDKVDSKWSGALPATVIYKADKKLFFEEELDYTRLKKNIEELSEF